MTTPYLAPFALNDGPLMLIPSPNGGWVVNQKAPAQNQMAVSLGAFSDERDMLIALGAALLPEGTKLLFSDDLISRPAVNVVVNGPEDLKLDPDTLDRVMGESKSSYEEACRSGAEPPDANVRSIETPSGLHMVKEPPTGVAPHLDQKAQADEFCAYELTQYHGIEFYGLTDKEQAICRAAASIDRMCFRRPGPAPHHRAEWTQDIELPRHEMSQADWDEIASGAHFLEKNNPDWSAKGAYQRAAREWLTAWHRGEELENRLSGIVELKDLHAQAHAEVKADLLDDQAKGVTIPALQNDEIGWTMQGGGRRKRSIDMRAKVIMDRGDAHTEAGASRLAVRELMAEEIAAKDAAAKAKEEKES